MTQRMHGLIAGRGTRWLLGAALLLPAGCRPQPPVTTAATPTFDARRLMLDKRELEREAHDLRGRILELERSLNAAGAEIEVARARLADRRSELAAVRRSHSGPAASPAAAEAVQAQSELGAEAVAYVKDLIAKASEGGDLGGQVDWAGMAGEMLSGGAEAGGEEPIDPEQAAAFIESLPEAERNAALGEAREAFSNVLGGNSDLWKLKPEVGDHYVFGKKVKVEMLGRDADGKRQRFSVTVAKKDGKLSIVSIDRG